MTPRALRSRPFDLWAAVIRIVVGVWLMFMHRDALAFGVALLLLWSVTADASGRDLDPGAEDSA